MEGFTQFRDESGKVQMIINKFRKVYPFGRTNCKFLWKILG